MINSYLYKFTQNTVQTGGKAWNYLIGNTENIIMFGIVLAGAFFIQILLPPGTRSIIRRFWVENFSNLSKGFSGAIAFFGISIDAKYLREYRCPKCDKLLAKGNLSTREDALEVKCRNCGGVYLFTGEDADIIKKRSVFLREGLIPDPEAAK